MFEIKEESGEARSGLLHTAHGKIKTPFFMPVATKASVKSIEGSCLEEIGFEALIANSFILSLNAGAQNIRKLGGLHKYMNFNKCIFTDSGGFQVLSKDFCIKKTDKGVIFKNPFNGDKAELTPEKSMEIQIAMGSDVAMTLDDVPHHGLNGKDYVDSIKRTHAWAKRALQHHKMLKKEYASKQLLFGIAQGSTSKEYRVFSTNAINKMDFDGVALGGLVVGEKRNELMDAVKLSVQNLNKNKPRYLMGLGSPPDIIQAIGAGVDCFDSAYPTANARHGSLFTDYGRMQILKKEFHDDPNPLVEGCNCFVCKNYSRAYVQHQLRAKELLGYRLVTIHNLTYMHNLVERAKKAIKKNNYAQFQKEYLENYFSKKENKEFSNKIKEKYYSKDEKPRHVFLIEHKK